MNRNARIALVAGALGLIGWGAVSTTARGSSPTELLVVRPGGANGPLTGLDTASGRARFSLPAGVVSADGRSFFSAASSRAATTLRSFDPTTGALRRTFRLPQRWSLAGVSSSGHWLALTQKAPRRTVIGIADARKAHLTHVLKLSGRFDVETVSADGSSLFLIQHLRGGRYLVRLYDLSHERLVADPLRAKGGDEFMVGYAWSGLASRDGTWLLTLYLSTERNAAFIHALNLPNRSPICIVLPSGSGRFDHLKQYSLSLAPDGSTLFAANPTLGVVAEIDLRRLRVIRTTRFAGAAGAARTASAISRDGRALYFSSGQAIWAYDRAAGVVRGPYRTDGAITGLGLSRDDRYLFLAETGKGVTVLDAASGQRLGPRRR